MKDLDFDELDRAVSSLMGNKTTPVSENPSSPSQVSDQSEAPPVSASQPSTLAASTAPVASRPSRPTSPAVRRPGRFMDVVGVRKDATASNRSVSRQGISVQPAAAVTVPDPVIKPIETQVEPEPPVVQSPVSEWPDPLEMASRSEESSDQSKPVEPLANPLDSQPMTAADDKGLVPDVADEPLSSPFLPDAKVEKRPLGSAALASTETALMVEDESAQLPALPKDVEPALPEELHGDVVSIEADDSTTNPAHHAIAAPEPSVETTKKDNIPPREVKPAVTVTEAAVPSGPTSIAQQYKEEPTTGDTKNGAIYDTDSYHQPLSHPAKKKSGWGWVLWIILILALGAGGGAALYLLKIF